MKRLAVQIRVVSVIGALAAFLTFPALRADPVIAEEFKFAAFPPPKALGVRLGVRPFAKEVAQHTDGKIQFKIFAGGSLLGARDTLTGIRDGKAEAGFVVPAFVGDALPHVNLIPGLLAFASDTKQATGAAIETLLLHCPECEQDYATMNAVYLGGAAASPYWLQCAQSLEKPVDLQGKTVRIAGAASSRWVKALGGEPRGMPPGKIVPSMQQGNLDCAIALPGWLRSFKLQDVIRQVVTYPQGVYHGLGYFVFHRPFWEGRSSDEKRVFLKAIAKAAAASAIQGRYIEESKVVDEIIKAKGIKVSEGGPGFEQAWQEFLKGEVEAVITASAQRGIPEDVARRIVNAHVANLKKWAKISEEVGLDKEKFEQALWEHVYSKVKF